MANANLPELVTDYTVDWHNDQAGELPEDKHFEHGYVTLDNGYVVSLVRTNLGPDSFGFDEGKWEALPMRQPKSFLAKMMGLAGEPAPELNHLLTHDTELPGQRVVGALDSAGVNALIATVAQAEQAPEGDPTENFLKVLGGGA